MNLSSITFSLPSHKEKIITSYTTTIIKGTTTRQFLFKVALKKAVYW